jgi:hypothetical protein
MSIKRKSNPYDFPISQAVKSLPKNLHFQAVLAPEERRLFCNFPPISDLSPFKISAFIL